MTNLWVWLPYTNQQVQRPHPKYLIYWALTLGCHPPAHLITLEPDTKVPEPQRLSKFFKPSNTKTILPVSPILSCRNHDKGSYPCFPLPPSPSWLTLVLHSVALLVQHTLSSWELWVGNYLFNDYHLFICRPCNTWIIIFKNLHSHKIYIRKPWMSKWGELTGPIKHTWTQVAISAVFKSVLQHFLEADTVQVQSWITPNPCPQVADNPWEEFMY